MKPFIRSLNIRERKGYVFSVCYSCFVFFHLFIVKVVSSKLNLGYLTLITESGAVISLICFYRILMTLKKFTKTNSLEIKKILHGGIFSFLSYILIIASLYWSSITITCLMLRLYPFFFLISEYIMNDYELTHSEITSFIISFITGLIIIISTANSEKTAGVFLGLLGLVFKVIATQYWKHSRGVAIDLLLLSVGFISAGVGGVLMVFTYKNIEKLSPLAWIFIVLNAFATYYTRIFLLKVIKVISNVNKIVILNCLLLILALPVDYFVFGDKFNWYYLTLILIGVNSIFFTQNVFRRGQLAKNKN